MEMSHLIDLNDYPVEWWNEIISLGEDIKKCPEKYDAACNGKIMATLFYEPSTRTQMSFQTAMLRLGGKFIGFDNPKVTSVAKGENLKDTSKVISSYADLLVIRHENAGAAKAAALTSECSVINAGDGGHLHPTQTLTDLLTLKIEKGRLDNMTIGVCGDLKNGRTVHSLCKAMCKYSNNKFVLISSEELRLPPYVKDFITANGSEFTEALSIDEVIGELDVLYMTRLQKERFDDKNELISLDNAYILDSEKLKKSKETLAVMHPLPRVDEITVDIDGDPRCLYFKQAKYGAYVRMALIIKVLENSRSAELLKGQTQRDIKCQNAKCITNHEHYLPGSFKGEEPLLVCEYCDEIADL